MSAAAPRVAVLSNAYRYVRSKTEDLCRPLSVDDHGVQPIADVSPPKWHLAHTTWFFETFLLRPYLADYRVFDEQYSELFNSYYEGVGSRHPRAERGNLSRPTLDEIHNYRRYVDVAMTMLLDSGQGTNDPVASRTMLGLNHEQQHQELIVTDLKFILGHNPLRPAYQPGADDNFAPSRPQSYVPITGGLVMVGAESNEPFCFDNETPRHRVWLEDFEFAERLVTNQEYLAFIEDGGYRTPSLWLSDGWREASELAWQAPEYWTQRDSTWYEYTLAGESELHPTFPVTHISFYEADAFARWSGARLATEFEWEHVAKQATNEVESTKTPFFHPRAATGNGVQQLLDECWQWTASSYAPYPGFRPLSGSLGEYNGKFMANQMVLRGGSCASPGGHVRNTYRNFFYAKDRWQFTGIRLVRNGAKL